MKMANPFKPLCQSFFLALKTAMIHQSTNQSFKSSLSIFLDQLYAAFAIETTISIEAALDHIFVNGERLRTDITFYATYEFLDKFFTVRNINGFEFNDQLTASDVEKFLETIARLQPSPSLSHASVNELLSQQGIVGIKAIERNENYDTSGDQKVKQITDLKKKALKSYVRAVEVMKESVQADSPQGMKKAKRLVYGMVDLCLDEGFSFLGLSNIKNYDEYTFNHSINVCVIAIAFGKHLGLSKKQLAELGIAAMFHDYGKTEIPKNILNKPGKFEPHEWEVMKSHPLQSVKKLLEMSQFSLQDIKKIIAAFEHHRNYDRTGYPVTGMDKPMNFYSKVVAIADAYDAMTTNRVYQRAMLAPTALKILADNAGTKFDPLLIKAFINTVGIYPVGSLIKLKGGMLGVVLETHKDPSKIDRPIVGVLRKTPEGYELSGVKMDMAEAEHTTVEILEILAPEDLGINVSRLLFDDVAQELGSNSGLAKQASAS